MPDAGVLAQGGNEHRLRLIALPSGAHRAGDNLDSHSKEQNMSTTSPNSRVSRLSTETKAAFKTTEFIAYVVILVGMFIASAMVDSNEDGQGFGAEQVWLYATLLTIGYMISRGLAKAGSRENFDRDDHAARR